MKEMQIKKMGRKVASYSIVFIIMLMIFSMAMLISYALPNQSIQEHIKESKDIILRSNGNPFFGEEVKGAILDEYTDLLILNTAMNKGKEEEENILVRAFENSRFSEEGGNQFLSLEQTLEDENLYNNQEYARYWHGNQTIIRPLLLIFNIEEMRFLFYIVMFLLLMIATISIAKNLNNKYAIALFFSMIVVCFFIIPSSLQYISVFAITLFTIILVNILYKIKKEELYPYLFFIIGGCTSFFDLLTTPILTLGMPLLFVVLLKNKEKCDVKQTILEIIKLSILWCISYASIFFAKWVIASIVLQKDVITVAINNIIFRANGNESYPTTRLGAIQKNLEFLNNKVLNICFIFIIVIWFIMMINNKKKIKDIKIVIPLLFVSLYPYIWYFTFAGHSMIHSYFTYRAQAIAVLGVLCSMIQCIDFASIKIKGGEKWKK
ncbi:MAG: hypothetical protein HFJ34_06395 [Clostridia bacterium]|nr:hypothetical protein [Clostridia bacterium]